MMTETNNLKTKFQKKINSVLDEAQSIIVDKPNQIKLAVSCLIAGGHLLLEDKPGMGKTSLMKALAKLFGLPSNRIQFTNDMLPADIIGTSVFQKESENFKFVKGPIFTNFVLADEINRASPRTQSAFLQAMEEGRVNIDGQTYDLPKPFLVIATQNPLDSQGTFSLPESQIDRFMMRITLGAPSRVAEREILKGEARNTIIERAIAKFNEVEFNQLINEVNQIHVSDTCLDYLQDILDKSRQESEGLSPRAGRDFNQAAKAYAYISNRTFVIPEDYQAVGIAVMSHRLSSELLSNNQDIAELVMNSVPVS